MRPIWIYTPPPWQLRAVQELVLFPKKGFVQIIHQPVGAFVNADLLERLREERRKQGRRIEDLLEDALRLFLDPPPGGAELPVLPPAGPLVDLTDREALDRAVGPRP